jgi:hypothetical protein
MSFRPPPNQPDFSTLENLLLQGKVQSENPPLYQFLKNFLKSTSQMQGIFVTDIDTLTSGGGGTVTLPSGYWTLLTDGNVDETDFIFAGGEAISVFVPL